MARKLLLPLMFVCALLSACDMLGIDSPEKIAATREADGKAVGGACRHAGRAIEDCYLMNKKADRAAVFAGWREMNDYMRENKIEAVAPQVPAVAAGTPAADDAGPADKPGDKPVAKAATKGKAKAHDS